MSPPLPPPRRSSSSVSSRSMTPRPLKWICALALVAIAACILAADPVSAGSDCADPSAVLSRVNSSHCCPTADFKLEMNPRGTGPRCTRCRLTEYRCEDGEGCCDQDRSCVRDSNGRARCSASSAVVFSWSVDRSSTNPHLDRVPSALYSMPSDSLFGWLLLWLTGFVLLLSMMCGVGECMAEGWIHAHEKKKAQARRVEAQSQEAKIAAAALVEAQAKAAAAAAEQKTAEAIKRAVAEALARAASLPTKDSPFAQPGLTSTPAAGVASLSSSPSSFPSESNSDVAAAASAAAVPAKAS